MMPVLEMWSMWTEYDFIKNIHVIELNTEQRKKSLYLRLKKKAHSLLSSLC